MTIKPHNERQGEHERQGDPRPSGRPQPEEPANHASQKPSSGRRDPNTPIPDTEADDDLDNTVEQSFPASDPPPGPGGH